MRANDSRIQAVRIACGYGKWKPVPFPDAVNAFDAGQIECIECGHRLRWNQRVWRYRHEFPCSERAAEKAAALAAAVVPYAQSMTREEYEAKSARDHASLARALYPSPLPSAVRS